MTHQVLMIRPMWFAYDSETAASNAFQHSDGGAPSEIVQRAQVEFDDLAAALTDAGIEVLVVHDRADCRTPDSVFPNNWLSFHRSGHAVLYPMLTPSRRAEVRPDLIEHVESNLGTHWPQRIDLTPLAETGAFVEGTGSLIFDPLANTAFACRSPRTTDAGLDAIERALGIETVRFGATDESGVAYYHTNVMLSIGPRLTIVCTESIDESDQDRVLDRLQAPGREIMPITRAQVRAFVGNALSLRSSIGDPLVVMSDQARKNLNSAQRGTIERAARIISSPLPTIERIGGGSARCMIAEINLPA